MGTLPESRRLVDQTRPEGATPVRTQRFDRDARRKPANMLLPSEQAEYEHREIDEDYVGGDLWECEDISRVRFSTVSTVSLSAA